MDLAGKTTPIIESVFGITGGLVSAHKVGIASHDFILGLVCIAQSKYQVSTELERQGFSLTLMLGTFDVCAFAPQKTRAQACFDAHLNTQLLAHEATGV